MQGSDGASNPFAPPTYGEPASYANESVNVPLTPSAPMSMQQPPPGELPPPKRKVLFFHVLFKALALFVYITSGVWGTSYVLTFVLVTLLMAAGALACRRPRSA